MLLQRFAILSVLIWGQVSLAECLIRSKNPLELRDDVISHILSTAETCPQNVSELKALLSLDGLTPHAAMVANRGRHNPSSGSFSFFETVTGDSNVLGQAILAEHLYVGHFTHAFNGELSLDQTPGRGKLLIELLAWDFTKEMYNFYELIFTATRADWFYQGDSKDAFLDNAKLHLQADPNNPQFGQRMRCSGCHTTGGPIMKELAAPHNDWWTKKRGLLFGAHEPTAEIKAMLKSGVDASNFALNVKRGIQKLDQSAAMKTFKKSLSLPEQLRPIFCTMEINLVSDLLPLEDVWSEISLPVEYFASPWLAPGFILEANKNKYQEAIKSLGFKFPETTKTDADHAWLAPVKGFSDHLAIAGLIEEGVVDAEFVGDVMAVDMLQPLFSSQRCELLKLVPKDGAADWQQQLQQNLKRSSLFAAPVLLANLTQRQNTLALHKADMAAELKSYDFSDEAALKVALKNLDKTRSAVFESEISQNPRGQILEPGFRVIFPTR